MATKQKIGQLSESELQFIRAQIKLAEIRAGLLETAVKNGLEDSLDRAFAAACADSLNESLVHAGERLGRLRCEGLF